MSRFFPYIVLVLLMFGFSVRAYSQANSEDFRLWSGVTAQTKLAKKLSGKLGIENRLRENATENYSNLLELGMKYKGLKVIDLYANYRFTDKIETYGNRFDFRVRVKEKIVKRTYFSLVVKSQFEKETSDKYWDSSLRFKWEIEHKIKKQKIFPYFSNEWFYDLSDAGNEFNGYRITLGVSIDTFKKQSFKLGYALNKQLNSNNPKTNNILGIAYKFKI